MVILIQMSKYIISRNFGLKKNMIFYLISSSSSVLLTSDGYFAGRFTYVRPVSNRNLKNSKRETNSYKPIICIVHSL